MAKSSGVVGFATSTEVNPGDFRDVIVEKSFFGDVTSQGRQELTTDQINDEFTADVTLEIVADWIGSENMIAIRYAEWAGTKWKVTNVKPRGVRLLLRLGGVYNGPTASVSS